MTAICPVLRMSLKKNCGRDHSKRKRLFELKRFQRREFFVHGHYATAGSRCASRKRTLHMNRFAIVSETYQGCLPPLQMIILATTARLLPVYSHPFGFVFLLSTILWFGLRLDTRRLGSLNELRCQLLDRDSQCLDFLVDRFHISREI
jgi:hypothetical protein